MRGEPVEVWDPEESTCYTLLALLVRTCPRPSPSQGLADPYDITHTLLPIPALAFASDAYLSIQDPIVCSLPPFVVHLARSRACILERSHPEIRRVGIVILVRERYILLRSENYLPETRKWTMSNEGEGYEGFPV